MVPGSSPTAVAIVVIPTGPTLNLLMIADKKEVKPWS